MSRIQKNNPSVARAGSKPKTRGSSKSRKPRAANTIKTAAVRPPAVRNDGFESAQRLFAATAIPAAETVAPAVLRALFGAASAMHEGQDAQAIATDAARVVLASPEMLAAFKQALPALENVAGRIGGKAVGEIARQALPLVANGQTVKALLKVAGEVGGPAGKRLMGAALRGLSNGGLAYSAAEIASTAAKLGAKSGSFAKIFTKAMPIVGNAMNLLSVGSALKALIDVLKDPDSSIGAKLAHALHLATTVAGCFIPQVGLAGDALMMGAKTTGIV